MHFLNGACRIPRRDNGKIGQGSGFAALAPSQQNARQAHQPALFQCLDDIGRVTRSADGHKQIMFGGFSGQLAGKNMLETIIIADRGQDGTVDRQGFGRQ